MSTAASSIARRESYHAVEVEARITTLDRRFAARGPCVSASSAPRAPARVPSSAVRAAQGGATKSVVSNQSPPAVKTRRDGSPPGGDRTAAAANRRRGCRPRLDRMAATGPPGEVAGSGSGRVAATPSTLGPPLHDRPPVQQGCHPALRRAPGHRPRVAYDRIDSVRGGVL